MDDEVFIFIAEEAPHSILICASVAKFTAYFYVLASWIVSKQELNVLLMCTKFSQLDPQYMGLIEQKFSITSDVYFTFNIINCD